MRRKLPLMLGAFFLAFAAGACEGPRGPAGPQGPQGEQGEQGPPGEDGEDGTNALNTCSDCHSSDATIVAIEQQFALSNHGFGNYEVRQNAPYGDCGSCHNHQEFIAYVTGTTADLSGGTASMNCRTCHQIHTTYEGEDFALTTTDSVTLRLGGATLDFGGSANLCATCHQARVEDDWARDDSDSTYTLPDHYGLHHGPQASMFATEIPAEIDFGTTPPGMFGSHVNNDITCTGCHMGYADTLSGAGLVVSSTPDGELGHTYAPGSDVCGVCHGVPSAADTLPQFDYGGVQTDTETAMHELEVCLEAEGLITCSGGSCSPNSGNDFRESYVAAFLVWEAVHEDGSLGVHAPKWIPGWAQAAADHMISTSTNATCNTQ